MRRIWTALSFPSGKLGAPSLRSKGGRKICLPLLLLPLLALSATAQTSSAPAGPEPVTTITLGQSIVALNGPWKFHIGDNPQWANPNFDDSHWETVDLTPKEGSFDPNAGYSGYVRGWTAKGHPGYWGWAWYRIRVRTTAQPGQKLALAGPADVDDGYQVFANGKLLGSFGKFSGYGPPVIYYSRPAMFPLPRAAAGRNGDGTTQVLAFRFWMEPNTLTFDRDAGGIHTAPLLGEAGVVAAQYQLAWVGQVRAYSSLMIEAALYSLLAMMACSLVLFDRSDAVYLWLAGVFLLTAANAGSGCIAVWTQLESGITFKVAQDVFLIPLTLGGWVMVWWVWFRLRHPARLPNLVAGLTLLYMVSNALGEDFFFSAISHPVGVIFHAVSLGVRLLFLLLLVGIAVEGVRQQGWEGWLALPAMLLVGIAQFQNELNILHIRADWFPFGALVTLANVADVFLAAAIFALLLRRLLLSLRRQRETALDIKQAQEVQRVLIPADLPHVPGLAIESEYRPAREVGGDFFQIVPHASDGSVLIVTGDVTGHGLQAGMLVALIVGAIRNQTETSFDPLHMLQSLNRRLMGRGHAHATGLALRVAADGAVTLANAGHLPPYLNDKELPMKGALPLGMIESAEFSVMHFDLATGDRLLLLSDGVAEAQDEQGQLFGFERIHDLLQKPITAAEVATAAQKFGQQDDISVLSIRRMHQAASPSTNIA
ncbi:MAG TPA: PP2C family protein-serine/threonine phosphatase [Acidobacteriaceae bacterium]|nr:PP2C family protein-serine/threonine phosphatase [Acidobacteriaceae bacterium]